MPKCYICGKDKPYQTEDFLLVREYAKTHGMFWYFCGAKCLKLWLERYEFEKEHFFVNVGGGVSIPCKKARRGG